MFTAGETVGLAEWIINAAFCQLYFPKLAIVASCCLKPIFTAFLWVNKFGRSFLLKVEPKFYAKPKRAK